MASWNLNSKLISALGEEGKPPAKHRAADAASQRRLRMLYNNSCLSICLTPPARAKEGIHCDNPGGIRLLRQRSVTGTVFLLQTEHLAPLCTVFATASIPLRLRHWHDAHQTSPLEKCVNRRVTQQAFPPVSLANTGNKNKG